MNGADARSADGGPLDEHEIRTIDRLPERARQHIRRIVVAMHTGDVESAVGVARDVPLPDRTATAEAMASVAGDAVLTFSRPKDWSRTEERRRSVLAFWLAAAHLIDDGAALGGVLQYLWRLRQPVDVEQLRAVLAERTPSSRRAFGKALSVRRDASLWLTARTLAAEGLLPEPAPLEPTAIVHLRWRRLPEARRDDPLVGEILDSLWTTPGAGQLLGTTWEIASPNPRPELPPDRSFHSDVDWAGLLDAWGATDPERRPTVIDACLGALAGAAGGRPSDLRGWALVHGRLQVDDAEATVRQSAYLALAAGAAAPAAAVGRAVLERLLDAGSLDAVGLVDTAADALRRAEKGAVREYLDLLDGAVRAGSLDAASCAEVVQSVVAELPRGVDSRARRLLTAWDAAVAGAVSGAGAGAEPVAAAAARSEATAQAWVPPAPVDLPESATVTPPTSVDDLVDLLLQVLSGGGEPVDVERALDGMMRLREPSPVVGDHLLRQVDRRAGHLVHGLSDVVSGWLGHRPAPARFGARTRKVRVYDEGEVVPGARVRAERWVPGFGPPSDGPLSARAMDSWLCAWDEVCWVPRELVGARFAELLPLVTGAPAGSLALPTHMHGGIDAPSLIARLRDRTAAGRPPGPRELATALQRLAPEDYDAVLASGTIPNRAAAWLLRLGVPQAFRQVVAEPQWLAYEQRRPVGVVALWQPDDGADGPPPTGDDPVHWWLDTRSVVDQWTDHSGAPTMWLHDLDLASWLLHLPWHADVAAVHMQPEIVSSTELADADLTGLLRTMGDRRAPLGPQAADLLCWAATYKNARVRAAASEAIAATALYGVLSGAELGRSVLRLVGPDAGPFLKSPSYLGPEPPKVSRIATTLADVARVHEHGEGAVLAAVVATLPELRSTRGGVALLELGAQIAERRGIRVTLPESLASLAAGRASSRLAEEARRISGVGRTAVLWEPRSAR